jgi:SOS response regulatory protein OraA/RecX
MDKKAKLTQLLQEYGYPQEAINRFMKDTEELNYEEARKRIMPYKDITAER